MALVIKDRVKETTTTTGTGAITLAGAATNFQTFTSVLSNADTTYYAIIDDTNGAFEVGLGTFASSGTTLTRTTVLESSNSGSAVNLGSGTKQVFMTYPAEKSVFLDASNQLVINGSSVTSSVAELNILDGKSFVDEDGMDSNSATAIASQQSIKAYVDAQLTAQDLDIQGDSGGALSIDLDSETLTIAGGTGISTSGSSNTITINGDDASTSSKGIASFSSDDFSVSSGAVTIKAGGVTNTQLAGSIANSKLSNSSVNFGGVSLALGASDTTPAFDLSDATSYPTSSLSGTITNAQLAGSIADSKLSTITTAGKVDIGALEIDGATDIGADLVDADLVIVDDGANGTERKSTLTRVKKYIYSAASGDATASDSGAITLAAAQTNVTSLLATDIKIGEDDQTKIDFETADEIHFYAANAEQVFVSDGVFGPQTDSDVDLGTNSVRWKNAFIDTVTSTTFTGALTGTASLVAVTDSTANTNFPVVFHDESNALLDDTGALRYNPSTGELLVPKLTVAGTTTVVDTVTMNAANAIVFEGATADAHETTLSIVDPTADHTQYLINQGGYIPVLAAATTTAITATPGEINLIDGDTSRGTTAVASGDGILINDAGTMRMTNVDTVSTYFASHNVGGGNIVTTGALNSGSITSGFGNINTGSSTITTTGAVATGALTAGGILKTDDATEATSTTDGSLQTDGGLSVVKDAVFGDDVKLLSDAAVLNFGADSDVTLTHVADTALLLNSSRQLQFGDSGTYIHQSADGVLDLVSDTEVEINGTTIDINGNVDISGTTTQTGVSTSAAKDIFNAGMSVKNGATSAGFIEFFEDSDNGTNKATLIGPSSTSDVTLTLPSSAGTLATTASAADEATALAIALG
jgi:hypothetical protein